VSADRVPLMLLMTGPRPAAHEPFFCRPLSAPTWPATCSRSAPSGVLLFGLVTAAGLEPEALQAKRPGRVAQGVKVRSSKASSARAGSSRFSSTLAAGDQACRLRHVTDDKSLSNWCTQAVAERTHSALKAPPPPGDLFVCGPQPATPFCPVWDRNKQGLPTCKLTTSCSPCVEPSRSAGVSR
jgi:hypothetical protein